MWTMLWAYVAFVEFLIIWAEDLPREIAWFVPRLRFGLGVVSASAWPRCSSRCRCCALLFRANKDDPRRLARLATWLLRRPARELRVAGRAVDRAARLAGLVAGAVAGDRDGAAAASRACCARSRPRAVDDRGGRPCVTTRCPSAACCGWASPSRVAVAIAIGVVLAILAHRRVPVGGVADRRGPRSSAGDLPMLQTAPQPDLAAYKAEKLHALHDLGWVDAASGVAHVPIETAMAMQAASRPRARERRDESACVVLALALAHARPRSRRRSRPRATARSRRRRAASAVGFTQHLGAALPLAAPFTDSAGRAIRLADELAARRPPDAADARLPPLPAAVRPGDAGRARGAAPERPAGAGGARRCSSASTRPRPPPTPPTRAAPTSATRALLAGAQPATPPAIERLVGPPASIARARRQRRLRLPARGDAAARFAHPAGVVVVTPDGRVSRYLMGVRFDPAELRDAVVDAARRPRRQPQRPPRAAVRASRPARRHAQRRRCWSGMRVAGPRDAGRCSPRFALAHARGSRADGRRHRRRAVRRLPPARRRPRRRRPRRTDAIFLAMLLLCGTRRAASCCVLVVVLRDPLSARHAASTARRRASCSGIEIAWTVAPLLVFFGIFGWAARDFMTLADPPRRRAAGHRRRQAVDVEAAAPQRPARDQRAARAAGRAGGGDDDVGGRDPQLLHPGVPHQAGRGAGPLHAAVVHGDAARRVPAVLLRVLRQRAFADDRPRRRDDARRLRPLARVRPGAARAWRSTASRCSASSAARAATTRARRSTRRCSTASTAARCTCRTAAPSSPTRTTCATRSSCRTRTSSPASRR